MTYNFLPKTAIYDFDDFSSNESHLADQSLSPLQELILDYLKELAYYLLKLKDMGANNELIKEKVIEAVSGIITNVDYNQEQFEKLVLELAEVLYQAKTLYANLCYKYKIKINFLKSVFKFNKNLNIKEIIKKNESHYVMTNVEYTWEEKNLFDIMLFLIKNLCIKIIQIKSYKKDYENAYRTILILLSTMKFENMTVDCIKSIIEDATNEYQNLVKCLSDAQEEAYGERESVYISFAPRNGKAILVSGIDMTQLEAVLEATKDKKIDVYTHGMTMLMAHTLPKFKIYPNLVGHFGQGSENSLFDFAAFPGAVLMTRYLFQKVEYLYRGRIFTTDTFAPMGIVKIKNNDYSPLIQAALDSKGFTKEEQEIILRVGFRQKLMDEIIEKVIEQVEKNEIRHVYFIGLLHHESEYEKYFEKFLKIMPKDCFAISLAHEKNEENILHVDSYYDYLYIYKVMDKINEKKSLKELPITIFMTKCDQFTVTNILNFINRGIKNIFLCKCFPTIINPALVETLKKTFGVKTYSTPEEDLKITLSEQ